MYNLIKRGEKMGTMAKKINQLLIEVGMDKQTLAKILGTTQSNIS